MPCLCLKTIDEYELFQEIHGDNISDAIFNHLCLYTTRVQRNKQSCAFNWNEVCGRGFSEKFLKRTEGFNILSNEN